jgi:hypothetical protein
MSAIHTIVRRVMPWMAQNARAFSYMLPDSMELALYITIAAYFAMEIKQAA